MFWQAGKQFGSLPNPDFFYLKDVSNMRTYEEKYKRTRISVSVCVKRKRARAYTHKHIIV